jgi:dolichol-phosphate mannosyltransferase
MNKNEIEIKYTIIFPVFNEEENIVTVYERTRKVLERLAKDYEIIFVNDGSIDKTAGHLADLHIKDKKVKVINFSRNFGHQVAVTAGLDHATGDYIAILDADLQDPPEVLPEFFKKAEEGYDVVFAIRKNRKENLLKKTSYKFFYRILHKIANIDIPLDSGDFCVMSRRAVKALNSLPERNRFIRGLRSWIGFKQIGIEYERAGRLAGESKYSFAKLLKLAFDGIFSFSYAPLQFMFYLGLFSLIVSTIGVIGAIYLRFFTTAYKQVPGFATTIILVMFIGGLQLFSIGVLGEYLRRLYEESKQRPQYIVESTIGF